MTCRTQLDARVKIAIVKQGEGDYELVPGDRGGKKIKQRGKKPVCWCCTTRSGQSGSRRKTTPSGYQDFPTT